MGKGLVKLSPVAQGSATPTNAQYVDNGDIISGNLANAFKMVDDGTNRSQNDTDTTYIRFALSDPDGVNWTFKAAIPDFPPGVVSIDEVQIWTAVSRLSVGGGAWAGIAVGHDGAVSNVGERFFLNLASPAFVQAGHSMPVNPITGKAWVATDFTEQLFEMGYYKAAGPSRPTCTNVFVEVHYTTSDFQPGASAPATGWTIGAAGVGSWNAAAAATGSWTVGSKPTTSWGVGGAAPATTWTKEN